MKRKKWTEEEEQTLISTYSSLLSSPSPLSKLRTTRQKKFQPVADSVNALHHLRDPSSFPFLWSWRDVSIKIHNMRHQFLNVKQKLLSSSPSLDPSHALHLWPNFLRYKQVFGDIDLDCPSKSSDDYDEDDSEEDQERQVQREQEQEERVNSCGRSKKKRKGACYRKERWRRREERREVEEMEWMERVVAMQMDHEKRAMQMHADACQAQLQMIGILVRVVCQFLGPPAPPPDGGDGGISNQVVENLQQRQRAEEEETTTESLVGDDGNGKNDGHSGAGYL